MNMLNPPPVAPPGPRRLVLHKDTPTVAQDPARTKLESVLRMAGWTNRDLAQIAGVSTDHLRHLIATTAPDVETYVTWGHLGRTLRLNLDGFKQLLTVADGHNYDGGEIHALVSYGRGLDLDRSVSSWLIEHVNAGNRVEHVRPWGKHAPAWLVAWSHTLIPPTDVPEVQFSDRMLWRYMDIVVRFPNLPEAVVAHTLMNSPNPITQVDEPGKWLLTCWNPAASTEAAA